MAKTESGGHAVTSKLTCGYPGAVSEITWTYRGHEDGSDVYHVARKFPAGAKDAKTTEAVVRFGGRRQVVFEDASQCIVVEPPPAEGKIRQTRVVKGVVYATVSVGSDDGITRGTRLRVYGGRAGREVLGTVEITTVEPEESMGRVSGPRAAEVREDDRVRPDKAGQPREREQPVREVSGRPPTARPIPTASGRRSR